MMIQRFATVPLPVEAVQVTEDNLEEVATWCNGSVRGTLLPEGDRMVEFNFRGEDQRANVGDWVVKYDSVSFFAYPTAIFMERFISY